MGCRLSAVLRQRPSASAPQAAHTRPRQQLTQQLQAWPAIEVLCVRLQRQDSLLSALYMCPDMLHEGACLLESSNQGVQDESYNISHKTGQEERPWKQLKRALTARRDMATRQA